MHKVTQTREARGRAYRRRHAVPDDDPHHQAAAEAGDTRAQAEGTGQENDTSALLVDAIRTTKAEIRKHDTDGRPNELGKP
jgi:hypothetical protein